MGAELRRQPRKRLARQRFDLLGRRGCAERALHGPRIRRLGRAGNPRALHKPPGLARCAPLPKQACGAVAEWSKAHAWKVCIRQKRIVGSNPTRSATKSSSFRTNVKESVTVARNCGIVVGNGTESDREWRFLRSNAVTFLRSLLAQYGLKKHPVRPVINRLAPGTGLLCPLTLPNLFRFRRLPQG